MSAGAGFTVPQIVEQQPDADLPQAVSQPQPTNRPQHSEERNVSRRNQEGAVKLVKLSTDTAKRSGKREIPLESDQGLCTVFYLNVGYKNVKSFTDKNQNT